MRDAGVLKSSLRDTGVLGSSSRDTGVLGVITEGQRCAVRIAMRDMHALYCGPDRYR